MNPYYIVAPRYIRTSAGVRVLYKLCDLINKAGGSSFIYLRPYSDPDLSCSPLDIAPFLTNKIASYHFEIGLTPIVIYPETFNIKPFDAPFKIRYFLNYNQLLFSNNTLEDDDYFLSYSKNIAKKINLDKPITTLFLPVSDPIFYSPPEIEKRNGAIFYAGKFKYHFGGKTFPITDGLLEITRDKMSSQTPDELRKLFQESELFYCYEDSALALEAMLCGCPTIFLPNEHFQETLGDKELLGLGYAWGAEEKQIEHAKRTVQKVRERYIELSDLANKEVIDFIHKTQLMVKNRAYTKPFAPNRIHKSSWLQKIENIFYFLLDNIEDRGVRATLKIIYKRLSSKRLRLF